MQKNKKTKIFIVFGLIFLLIFNMTVPVFANTNYKESRLNLLKKLPESEQNFLIEKIENPEFSNLNNLSKEQQSLVNKVTNDPDRYLADATVWQDQEIIIYSTPEENTMIGNTGGYIEVIQQVDDYTFLINGEKHYIEHEYILEEFTENGDNTIFSNTYEVINFNPGGPWRSVDSRWYYINLDDPLQYYTVSALAIIITSIVKPWAGVLIDIAIMVLGTIYKSSDRVEIYRINYDHQILPLVYKWSDFNATVKWAGRTQNMGWKSVYYRVIPRS